MRARVSRFLYGVLVVWPAMWLNIPQSIVGIFTLGYWVPSWDVDYMFWAGRTFNVWTRSCDDRPDPR